jgi:hypothetical protein
MVLKSKNPFFDMNIIFEHFFIRFHPLVSVSLEESRALPSSSQAYHAHRNRLEPSLTEQLLHNARKKKVLQRDSLYTPKALQHHPNHLHVDTQDHHIYNSHSLHELQKEEDKEEEREQGKHGATQPLREALLHTN